MKKIISIFLLFFSIFAFGQAPTKMNYQSVVRNASNNLIINSSVGARIRILQGSPSGSAVFSETHTASTNSNGLLTLEIGNGTVVSGSFSSINWSNGPYFIEISIDPAGGTSYSIVGTNQLMSVPYALFAANATQVTGTAGNIQYHNGTNWVALPSGTTGQILQSNGTAAPSWVTPLVCYADRDGDGAGDNFSRNLTFGSTCPTGFVSNGTDCNDNNSANSTGIPVITSATNRVATSFTANWTSVNFATAYFLDVATNAGFSSYVTGFNNLNVGNVTSLNITGLDACTNYYYRVRAVSPCGTSANSAVIQSGTYQCATFNFTGSDQSFTVPTGVSSVSVKLWGARGGFALSAASGSGGYVAGTLAVTSGSSLTIIAGGAGGDDTNCFQTGAGGYGGGTAPCDPQNWGGVGGGGGRSAIQITPGTDVVTAGGGGGGECFSGQNGGHGGAEGTGSGGNGARAGSCGWGAGAGGTSYTTNPSFSVTASTVGANNAHGKVQINW